MKPIQGTELLLLMLLAVCFPGFGADSPPAERATLIIVAGAPGDPEFAPKFETWARGWEASARKAGAEPRVIGLEPGRTNDLEEFKAVLQALPRPSHDELWIVLIGHGTFDAKDAKFNLRGPDLGAAELSELLKPFTRPLTIINAFSSSGPFLKQLSAPGRVVITATRSGSEQNFCRLGEYLSQSIGDPEADLDKDGQTSLLEAFLLAARKVSDFYKGEGRLVTEHALLDDNGDGLGTPGDWFRGIQATKKAVGGSSVDGLRAHQRHLIRSAREEKLTAAERARRDELEAAIARLREEKKNLPVEDYYNQLETLCLELARLYAQADQR